MYIKEENNISHKINNSQIDKKSALERVIQSNPADSHARADLGFYYYNKGDLKRAKTHFETAVSLDPSLKQVWSRLVEVNIKLKNYKHALTANNKVLEFVPNSEKYNKIKMELEKLTLEQAIQVNPIDSHARKDLGAIYYNKGDLKKAKMHFETAVSLEPSLKEVWSKLVVLDLKLKSYKHALIASKKLLELIPNSKKLNDLKVNIEKLLLEQAIQTNPTDPQVRKDLGNLHYSQGELSKAKIYLESAVSLEPSLKEVWEKLIEVDLKIENYKNALIACKKILEIEPKSKKYKKIKSNIEKLLELKDED